MISDDIVRAVRGLLATHLGGVEGLREHVDKKDYFDQYCLGILRGWQSKLDSDGLTERDLELGLPTIKLITRQIVKNVPVAAGVVKPFQAELKVVEKLFAARGLPNEAALRCLLNTLLEEYVTEGPTETDYYVANGEQVEMTADNWVPALEEFPSAYVLSTKRGSLNVDSEERELLERLYKEACSVLKKAYGKPSGTRTQKSFSHDDGKVCVELSTLKRQAELLCPLYCLSFYGSRELLGRASLRF